MKAGHAAVLTIVVGAAVLASLGCGRWGKQSEAEVAEPVVLTEKSGGLFSVAWRPDGRALATSSVDWTIRIWDPAVGKETAVIHMPAGGIAAVAWRPDGKALASAGDDGAVRIWDPTSGQQLAYFEGHPGTA